MHATNYYINMSYLLLWAGHCKMQKYRIFLQRYLDGNTEINNSHWIDFNYYSSVVSGNPHLMLINQLRNEQRTGQLAAPIPAGDMSLSSSGIRILPPFTPAGKLISLIHKTDTTYYINQLLLTGDCISLSSLQRLLQEGI